MSRANTDEQVKQGIQTGLLLGKKKRLQKYTLMGIVQCSTCMKGVVDDPQQICQVPNIVRQVRTSKRKENNVYQQGQPSVE